MESHSFGSECKAGKSDVLIGGVKEKGGRANEKRGERQQQHIYFEAKQETPFQEVL